MRLIAYEGPSGSGKGYQVAKLAAEQPDLFVLEPPVHPRIRENWYGAWSSSYLEYQAVSAAVMGIKDVLVDRFLFSRWVYRAMQFRDNQLGPYAAGEMVASLNNTARHAYGEALLRLYGPPTRSRLTVEIRVLLPSEARLMQLRALSGKQYPFDGRVEMMLYTELTKRFIEKKPSWVKVEVICS